jgi:hypothetical protein
LPFRSRGETGVTNAEARNLDRMKSRPLAPPTPPYVQRMCGSSLTRADRGRKLNTRFAEKAAPVSVSFRGSLIRPRIAQPKLMSWGISVAEKHTLPFTVSVRDFVPVLILAHQELAANNYARLSSISFSAEEQRSHTVG